MITTTSTAEAEEASQQCIQITTDLTLTLAILTTHNSSASASLTRTWPWPLLLLLTHYLSAHALPSSFGGKSVLEIGTGYSGLPGLVAARLGARHVTLTDIPEIVSLLSQNVCENVVINEVGVVEVKSLVWGEEEGEYGDNIHGCADGDYDIVLMSDVFYDVEMMEMLGGTLRRVGGEDASVGYNQVEAVDFGVSNSAGERRV